MGHKSEQLQIRVTPAQKRALQRLARRAGMDVSSYVLGRALRRDADRFEEILRSLRDARRPRFALAELNDFLTALPSAALPEAVADADLRGLDPVTANYVAAMVEEAADRKGAPPPGWTEGVAPLEEPYFAAPLASLRLHLLRAAPVPFRRRNLFVDASIGDRV